MAQIVGCCLAACKLDAHSKNTRGLVGAGMLLRKHVMGKEEEGIWGQTKGRGGLNA